MEKKTAAAIKIQRAWRKYCKRKIYLYFRNLIQVSKEGDPRILIKSVAQNEHFLCDAATQLYVRFRLAGKKFPPIIVYKIYTNAPICDVNSYAPGNYFKEQNTAAFELAMKAIANILQTDIEVNTNSDGTFSEAYEREENNPWRPIIAKHVVNLKRQMSELQIKKSLNKKYTFHFSKKVREQRQKRELQNKKQKWMQYKFKKEKLQNNGKDERISLENENGAEQLLEWSMNLDFDEYLKDWSTMGTSAVYSTRNRR